jgi:environmental stress-induced protein Ves
MVSVKQIAKTEFMRAQWKNGLGYTDQIAIHPAGADLRKADFLWRVSSAKIDQSSAFSMFPEHDRILLILEGKGIRLFHRFEEGEPEDSTDLPPFEPYEFPGDIQSRCELISGAVKDLSIFIRKGEVEASLEVVELNEDEAYEWSPQGRWNFALCPHAEVDVEYESLSEVSHQKEGDVLLVEIQEVGGQALPRFQVRSQAGAVPLVLISIA